jgi:hypothetical protein
MRVSTRVSAQHAQFLFSSHVDEPHGTTCPPASEPDGLIVFDIPAELKARTVACYLLASLAPKTTPGKRPVRIELHSETG